MDWHLECSGCGVNYPPDGLMGVCPECGRPFLVRYPLRDHGVIERAEVRRRHGMWRFRSFMPLEPDEDPITLGEGDTPLLLAPRLSSALNLGQVFIKDEATNPTGSFKSRGMSAAVTRAVRAGAKRFTLPTAGNAGVAAAAYGARAGVPVKVFAPRWTPSTIVDQIRAFGGDLTLLDGHIGECGKASRAWAAEHDAVDLSTLREPYRIEGKKTLALEIAMQSNWTLPDAIIYPTGGGTGLIGMWKGFQELLAAGWVTGRLPRMYSVQAAGCAPIVRAFEAGAATAEPWHDPVTAASGLRVPGTRQEGIDFAPEGGAAIAGALELQRRGAIGGADRVVVFNTGAGWLYREAVELPGAGQ
jgi:threonine synthase